MLLETVEDSDIYDWRIPVTRAAALWTACAVITAVTLFNWLLIEHPGVCPEIFTLHAPCAHAVAVACGLSLVLILNAISMNTKMICEDKCQYRGVTVAAIALAVATLMLLSVIAMGTVRLCGVAPGLRASYIMAPLWVAIGSGLLYVIIFTIIVCQDGGVCADEEYRTLKINFLISGWTLTTAFIMCVLLVILNVDVHVCINWGFLAAPLILVVPSAVVLMGSLADGCNEN